jgi:hypothetical protein
MMGDTQEGRPEQRENMLGFTPRRGSVPGHGGMERYKEKGIMIASTNAAAAPSTDSIVTPESSQETPIDNPNDSQSEQPPTVRYQSMLDGLNNFKEE